MRSPTNKLKIGVLGGKGLLGSALVLELGNDFETVAIDRENYKDHLGASFDVLINANGNSKRFWANEHIVEDFEASTASVYRSLFDFNFRKYIYISSSDVYEDHSSPTTTKEETVINCRNLSPYGFHKYLSEQIVAKNAPDHIILRCSMMIGQNITKGPFFDALHGKPLFITPGSRLQLITVHEVARIVRAVIGGSVSNEVFNVGGTGTFLFERIGAYVPGSLSVGPEALEQRYEMDVRKISRLFPIATSEEYANDFLAHYPHDPKNS
ncbi:MAG: hypothetical protein UY21_C0028G0004 [Microgenomates group bacterium GW2011_GWA1_48_10]|nr:MAG: hypothetical protein UY21_C0028G0004 [Microgenomates group bacterium GW2011_GWA1_48_10]